MTTLVDTTRHLAGAALLLLAIGAAQATELAVGDPAPEFALQGSDGRLHQLADYRGTTVVIAWFPKAFTGG